jgi:hypothetical protein
MRPRTNSRRPRVRAALFSFFVLSPALAVSPISGGANAGTNPPADPPRAASGEPQRQQPEACSCGDLVSINRRYHAVFRALKVLDDSLKEFSKPDAINEPYNDARWQALESQIDLAVMEGMRDTSEYGPTGFANDCSATVKPAGLSGCLLRALAVNEAVRQQFCQSNGRDMKASRSFYDFLMVAQAGYLAEQKFLSAERKRLADSCRFPNWTGDIAVMWERHTEMVRPLGGTKSGNHKLTIDEDETALFFLVNGEVIGRAGPTYDETQTENYTSPASCHGSMRGPKMSTISGSSSTTINASGQVFGGEASVNVDRTGAYRVWVKLPSGTFYGKAHDHSEVSGECANSPIVDTDNDWHTSGYSIPVSATGRAAPDVTFLEDTYSPPEKVTRSGNTTITEKVMMAWHLRRATPK